MTDEAATTAANAEQVAYWNEVGGPKWVRYQAMLDHQLDAVGAAAIDSARLKAGEAVLDIGCGCGSTTLEAARRVGPSGRATGMDISAPMLALARDRARNADLANATFAEADAQTAALRAEFDVIFSRFGVMFFEDPFAAFTNLHGALRPGGRVAFVCWQALHRNPWMAVPMMAAMKHVTMEVPSSPHAPGPFAFADAARVESILGRAGFQGIAVRGLDIDLAVGGGGDTEQTAEFLLDMGPLGRVLTGAAPELRDNVRREVLAVIANHATDDGVKMAGAVWIVTANA